MKRFLIGLILLAIFSTVFCWWHPNELKLGTVGFGTEFGIGDAGHLDFNFSGRLNIPGVENLVIGLGFGGGMIFHETDDLFYIDDYGYLYHEISGWYDYNFDFLLGGEIFPRSKINPFIMAGIGMWSFGFSAEDTVYGQSVSVSAEDNGVKIPIILGCDFALAKHVAITTYFKATPYSTDLEVPITTYDEYGYPIATRMESLGEWRGLVHLGVQLSFIISLPKPMDTDGDGVWDEYDECPNTKPGTIVNERGCPYKKPPKRETITFERDLREKGAYVTNEILFEFNSDKITPDSYYLLDQIGNVLEKHKDWMLEISGHTDSIGTESYNMNLSHRRAKSVRNYLLENFDLFARNLIAKGYGESRPVADNGTTGGRTQNRRVEFMIIKDR